MSTWSIIILIILISLWIALFIYNIILVNKIKTKKSELETLTVNCNKVQDQWDQVIKSSDLLFNENNELAKDNKKLQTKNLDLTKTILNQESEIDSLRLSYIDKKKQLNEAYENDKTNYENLYSNIAMDFLSEWHNVSEQMLQERDRLDAEIAQKKATVDSILTREKESIEKENYIKFHSLELTNSDLNDIKRLREIATELTSVNAINALSKAIYKVYYELPYNNLVGRLFSGRTVTGIYKITNKQNQMAYVGQAVDVASRWRQHIKRGLGAETPTQSKLYPVMHEIGPESFTFELLEECTNDKLNEREDYWQEFYNVREYGYSIR